MRTIATWNVNSLRVRLPQLTDWLAGEPVHTLALQETKLEDSAFPRAGLEELGFEVAFSGQRTYSGVAILARAPITDVVTEIPGFDDPQRRVLAATIDGVRVVNLYVPNGQSVESEKYGYKLRWLEALRAWLSEVRSGARARAVEAQLSRGAAGFSGSITLSLGGSS